ncbi:hypothetical protein BH11ARM2_BH11ARM2_29160 [soil metagenome]
MTLQNLLLKLQRSPLVASVQATEKSPVDQPETLLRLARASADEGVQVMRLEGVKNIRVIKPALPMPTIGVLKRVYPKSDVYITPTKQDADSLIELGCEVVAFDATDRVRPKRTDLEHLIGHIKRRRTLTLADCDTPEAAERAAGFGADMVSTTLGGYTPARAATDGPDLDLLREILKRVKVPVLAEGRFSQRWQVEAALRMGAVGVVVGGALNDPIKQTRALMPYEGHWFKSEEKIGAVDIGGTWLRFALFSPDWKLGEEERTPNPPNRADRIAWIRAKVEETGVAAVGVSTGGIVDPRTGEVWAAKEYLMHDHIGVRFDEETLGVPTVAFGDGHATAWAHACLPEYAGQRVATLALGTGVGAGFVQDGRIWCGRRGEYPRFNDLPTSEGRSYEELMGGLHLGKDVGEDAKERARHALQGATKAVRDLYFPDEIVIGGGVGLSEWMRPELEALNLRPSPFGGEAGLYGAAALVLFPGWR